MGEHLAALGYSVEYHNWSTSVYSNVNVVGQRTGTVNPNDIYVIGAHLDDMPTGSTAPGADDNASGSAATLIAADILSQYQWGCTLRFAFGQGRSRGCSGAERIQRGPRQRGDNQRVFEPGHVGVQHNGAAQPGSILPGNARRVRADCEYVHRRGERVRVEPDADQVQRGDLHDRESERQQVVLDQGYPAILTIENYQGGDFTPSYHTMNDRLSTLDLNYFTTMVQAAVGTFAHMTGV